MPRAQQTAVEALTALEMEDRMPEIEVVPAFGYASADELLGQQHPWPACLAQVEAERQGGREVSVSRMLEIYPPAHIIRYQLYFAMQIWAGRIIAWREHAHTTNIYVGGHATCTWAVPADRLAITNGYPDYADIMMYDWAVSADGQIAQIASVNHLPA